MALDCIQADITLDSQQDVDSFQANYGGGGTCDTVTGDLQIGSFSDTANLNGLSALERVGGHLVIALNEHLSDISGLSALVSVGGGLSIHQNGNLLNLDGLSSLASVGDDLNIYGRHPFAGHLQNIDGLAALTRVGGDLLIEHNYDLTQVDGLKNLTWVGGEVSLYQNSVLEHVDGLQALTEVVTHLGLVRNYAMTNIDGLSSLTRVGGRLAVIEQNGLTALGGLSSLHEVQSLEISANATLRDCLGVVRLVDPIDDHEAGPGHVPMPDVESGEALLARNAGGCNSIEEILGSMPLDGLNPGLNDAWFDPATNGQGFFITIFPGIRQVFLAWFTYDTERPPADVQSYLGEPGHRWLTAQGEYDGNSALLELWVTSGGIFDSTEPVPVWQRDGELLLDFTTCNAGTVQYDIPSIGKQGLVPIERVALENVTLCYELNAARFHAAGTH